MGCAEQEGHAAQVPQVQLRPRPGESVAERVFQLRVPVCPHDVLLRQEIVC